ncbi:GDNF-inducible zinc finger protein 1 [Lemmus lemmus]
MESGTVLLESKSSPLNLLHEMHELRLLGHLCDVTVRVEYQGVREDFMAHKAVLAATSKFFKEVFLNEKSVDGTRTNVCLNELQVVDFASFLEFVYTARVQVEEDRVQRMLEVAEKLKCLDLSETCFQLKKQMLESVLLESQSFSESQEVEASSGPQVSVTPSSKASVPGEDAHSSGLVDTSDYPIERFDNGLLPEMPSRKCKEKLDKKKDVAKPPYPKIRRPSGRLAGRKVFVEIPKKKYTRRLREQQTNAEEEAAENDRCPQDPSPDHERMEMEPASKSEASPAGVKLEESLQKVEGEKEEEEGKDGEKRSNFQCKVCEKAFLYEKSFLKHIRHHHGVATEVVYRCDTCGQTFANRCNLKSHQRHVHSSERHFPCELCAKKFKRKKDVKRHVLQVHEGGGERHRCDLCGKGLSSKTSLRMHERTHTGDRPYGCTKCEAKFSQPSALKTHMRIHTGERPFICDECGARFTQNHMLIYHKRCHTGERPYCCDQCGKQFTQVNALQRHHRIHTGEKPFMCNACGRTFTDKSTLRRHTSIHDKNTPWKSFLVIVDGSPKNDEGHTTEQPDDEYVSPKLSAPFVHTKRNDTLNVFRVVP